MASPFLGMDPYLEAPEYWRNVHDNLATEIQAQLAPLVRPRYYVEQEPRFIYDNSIGIGRPHQGVPDVALLQPSPARPMTIAPTAIAPAPLELLITADVPEKLNSIVIRTVENDELVTVIEILSLANKRPNHAARLAYLRKRQFILESATHFMEIDLLRGGERTPLAQSLTAAPYFITLSRVERRPVAEVWPLTFMNKIPILPIPLFPPDPDIPLDLQHALNIIYERSSYDLRIDYTQPPPPPRLSREDSTWLKQHLQPLRSN